MKKRLAIIATAIMMAISLTACGTKEMSDNGGGSLPVNASKDDVETSTSYIETPTTSGSESSTETSTGGTSTPAPAPADKNSLVPAFGAKMDDDLKLGEFVVNGIAYDIADDISVNEFCEDSTYKRGPYMNDTDIMTYVEDVGIFYHGKPIENSPISIEATINDELVEAKDWYVADIRTEKAPFEQLADYKIKAIRAFNYNDVENADEMGFVVRFVGGLTTGEALEYYEELLGKGYEVETIDPEWKRDIRLSVYKNSTVTMVIEYRNEGGINLLTGEQEDKWICYSIILFKND